LTEGNNTNKEDSLISDFEVYEKEFLLAHKKYSDLLNKADLFDPKVIDVVHEIIDLKKSLREGKRIDLIVDALAMLSKQNKAPKEYTEYLQNLLSAKKELALSSENLLKAKINTFMSKIGIDIPKDESRNKQFIRILNSKEPNTASDLRLLLDSPGSVLYEIYSAFLRKDIVLDNEKNLIPRSKFGESLLDSAKEQIFDIVSKEFFLKSKKKFPHHAYFHIFNIKNDLIELVKLKGEEKTLKEIKEKISQGHIIVTRDGHLISVTGVGGNYLSQLRKNLLVGTAKEYRDFCLENNRTMLKESSLYTTLIEKQSNNQKTISIHKAFSNKVANESRVDDISRNEYIQNLKTFENKSKHFDTIVDNYMRQVENLAVTDSALQPDLVRFLNIFDSVNPKLEELTSSMSEVAYLSSLVEKADKIEKDLSKTLEIGNIIHNKESLTISRAQLNDLSINKNRINLILRNKLRAFLDKRVRKTHLKESVSTKIINQTLNSKDFDKYVDLFVEQETVKRILMNEILSNRDIYSRTLKIRNGINCLFVIEITKEKIFSQLLSSVDFLVGEFELQRIRLENLKHVNFNKNISDKMLELQKTNKSIELFRKKSIDFLNEFNAKINLSFRNVEDLHQKINKKDAKKEDIVKNANKIFKEFTKTRENNKKIIEKHETNIRKLEKEILDLQRFLRNSSRITVK
jgi:hypothetical protein